MKTKTRRRYVVEGVKRMPHGGWSMGQSLFWSREKAEAHAIAMRRIGYTVTRSSYPVKGEAR